MEFACIYNRTLFRNGKTGYTIFSVSTRDYDEFKNDTGYIICMGRIPIYTKGMPLLINGKFVKSERGGFEFLVRSVKENFNDKETTLSFITEIDIQGIGHKTAEKIIEITGTDLLTFIQAPNAVALLTSSVRGITESIAREFIRKIRNTVTERHLYQQFHQFGCDYVHASKLVEMYGYRAEQCLLENCYTVGMAAGLPFVVCDSIAKSTNKTFYDKDRINALLLYAMRLLEASGHIYSCMDDIVATTNAIVRQSAFLDEIPPELLIRAAYNSKRIVIENPDNPVYSLSESRKYEMRIADHANRLMNTAIQFPVTDAQIDDFVNDSEIFFGIKYSKNQKQSFKFLKSSGVKILTGGPGTGKTTVINGLINAYRRIFPDNSIVLCAPTGRAAQRMHESTDTKASTIHRLLDIKPYGNEITCRDQSNPLDADLLIVDEMSMANSFVFSMLLGAVKNGALVLLCGDVDQLPAIGPGNVLNDMISSRRFQVNKLTVVYRQTETSSIISNAIKINNKSTDLKYDDSFEIINVEDDEINEKVKDIAKKYYDPSNPFSMQVLTTVKNGVWGVIQLNKTIQSAVNPAVFLTAYGVYNYRINDKIMTIRNNYNSRYVNGDLGTIKEINENNCVAMINNEEQVINKNDMSDVSLAYAATIHKAQGSEYDIVVIVLPDYSTNMLRRNLLYTAVTRAKSKVIILTRGNSLEQAILNECDTSRRTYLVERLNGKTLEII